MEKLIELLNEYEEERKSGLRCIGIDTIAVCLTEGRSYRFSYLISKEFGFIKRLVDNDKIDYKKLIDNINFSEIRALNRGVVCCLLMLLAIQGNPIDLLVSVLK